LPSRKRCGRESFPVKSPWIILLRNSRLSRKRVMNPANNDKK
jgi:hypothetical protein